MKAGVDYDDVRVDRAEWRAIKSTMPMGQIPVVEVDGHTLCQSAAIGRYFARKHRKAGTHSKCGG
jgi:glutathione S-transferase